MLAHVTVTRIVHEHQVGWFFGVPTALQTEAIQARSTYFRFAFLGQPEAWSAVDEDFGIIGYQGNVSVTGNRPERFNVVTLVVEDWRLLAQQEG